MSNNGVDLLRVEQKNINKTIKIIFQNETENTNTFKIMIHIVTQNNIEQYWDMNKIVRKFYSWEWSSF